MSRIRWYGPTLLLLMTLLVVMIFGPRLVRDIAHAQTDARITQIKRNLSENPSLATLSDAFRKVANAVEPSVVHIEVLSRRSVSRRDIIPRLGPPFDNFFEHRFQRPGQREDRDRFEQYDVPRPSGQGSGWVYDTDGHIITSAHVVDKADEIRITFNDGSKQGAVVVGDPDEGTDIAVLKVEQDNLHPASLAPSGVQTGEIVFAFGSPFGFEFSMSQGIVSGKGREIGVLGMSGYEDFIQTDAAINPGNSGGPLTNIYGEVVGMNTAIASRTKTYSGLGFTIPVRIIKRVVDQILSEGRVSRGQLGIFIKDLTGELARSYGFDGEGVLVTEPIPDSPAAKAGIEFDDIVTKVDGQPVGSAHELRFLIADIAPGTTVDITVFREGEILNIPVTLEEAATTSVSRSYPDRPQPGPDSEGADTLKKFGITSFDTFNEAIAERVGVDFQPGVIINSVRANSRANDAGIRRGSIITHVMKKTVRTVDDLIAELEKHDPAQLIRLRVADWNREGRRWSGRPVLIELTDDK